MFASELLTIPISIFVLFFPGFFVSLLFFKVKKINYIERISLSFMFSIILVPSIVFFINIFGVPITSAMTISVILGVVILSIIIIIIRYFKIKHGKQVQYEEKSIKGL